MNDDIKDKLLETDSILIPHGTLNAQMKQEQIESIQTPIYGNKHILDWESDRVLKEQLMKEAKFDVLALTVDTIVAGNRERDLRTGFTSPPKITLSSLFEYVTKPMWGINYVTRGKFELPL